MTDEQDYQTCCFPVDGKRHGIKSFALVPFEGKDWPLCEEHIMWLTDNMPLPNLAMMHPIPEA